MTYSVGSCWLFRNEAEWSLLASGYDDVVRNNQNFNSASSLYLEKVSWLRLVTVTCLLNFSTLQRCESYSLSPPELTYLTLWIGKTHGEGIDTFDIGVQYVRKGSRIAMHLVEFFPSTVGRSLEFVAVKKFPWNWKWRPQQQMDRGVNLV